MHLHHQAPQPSISEFLKDQTDQNSECTRDLRKVTASQGTKKPIAELKEGLDWLQKKAVELGLRLGNVNRTLDIFKKNYDQIANTQFITIIDFDAKVETQRMFIFDVQNQKFVRMATAHGSGSDKQNHGRPEVFGNDPVLKHFTKKSSVGCMLTGSTYKSASKTHKTSTRLLGFEKGFNDQMCRRHVVLHKAAYTGRAGGGRSWGCLTFAENDSTKVQDILKPGSLICTQPNPDDVDQSTGQRKPGYFP